MFDLSHIIIQNKKMGQQGGAIGKQKSVGLEYG